jgi:hypothetical protein
MNTGSMQQHRADKSPPAARLPVVACAFTVLASGEGPRAAGGASRACAGRAQRGRPAAAFCPFLRRRVLGRGVQKEARAARSDAGEERANLRRGFAMPLWAKPFCAGDPCRPTAKGWVRSGVGAQGPPFLRHRSGGGR